MQEANRIFGAIDSALKVTEEIAAARAAMTQQDPPGQPAARSHGAASPGSSQGNAAGDRLYGSSPESASNVHSAGVRYFEEDRKPTPKGSDAAAASPTNGPSVPAAGVLDIVQCLRVAADFCLCACQGWCCCRSVAVFSCSCLRYIWPGSAQAHVAYYSS